MSVFCVSVRLSVHENIPGTTNAIFTKFFMHVANGRGSVLLRLRCDTLCTSGFVDEIMFFFYNGLYSGMNFTTKKTISLKFTYLPKVG